MVQMIINWKVQIFLLRTEILAGDSYQAFQLNETATLMW